MRRYLAGRALRDELLDLSPAEPEWLVTATGREALLAAGFRPDRHDPWVYRHPETGEPHRLARHEFLDSRDASLRVRCDPTVSVEEALTSADLTINAMARDRQGRLIDPCHGRSDLDEGVLRHASPLFRCHPEYLLSTAAHAAQLAAWGFHVAHGTYALMKVMAAGGALHAVGPAHIWRYLEPALLGQRPSEFFRVLHRCGALKVLSAATDSLFEADGQVAHGSKGVPPALRCLDMSEPGAASLSGRLDAVRRQLGTLAPVVSRELGMPEASV